MTKNTQPEPSPTPHAPDGLMDTKGAAAFLALSPLTLIDWRHKGKGPDHVKCGALCRYRLSDLQAWLDSRTKKGA